MFPMSSLSRCEKPAATPLRSNGESGQVLILVVLVMTLVLVVGVIVVDFGMWFSGRASVVNAVDQATMAGSLYLPKDGAKAATVARQYVLENDPEIEDKDIEVSFRCIVGDRNGDGQPDSGDIPAVCPQLTAGAFTCINDLCYANCSFTGTAKCNTLVVKASKDVPFGFGPMFGVNDMTAAGFVSAACRGACGGPPTAPLDLVEIIDRTNSMCPNNQPQNCMGPSTDLTNAKNGAKAVLELYNPEVQRVALATLPKSLPRDDCTAVAHNDDPGNWTLTPLLSDYKNPDDSLNNSSEIVSDINCLKPPSWVSAQTDLGSPTEAAKELLMETGRLDVKWGIILLTDGAANQPTEDTGYLNCAGQTGQAPAPGGHGDGFEHNAMNACTDGSGQAEDSPSGTNNNTGCRDPAKDQHDFYNYGISVPGGNAIVGIEVRLDAWVDSTSWFSTRRMCVQLSWDGGTSWTTAKQTSSLSTSEDQYTLGDSGDTWGYPWTPSELSDANFRVRVTDVYNSTSRTFYLDWAAVRVYHLRDRGPCAYAAKQAAAAKDLVPPIEIFTIGFGVSNQSCTADAPSSPYHDVPVTKLLADMATDSLDDHNHCRYASDIVAENADGDHFLCEARGADLEPIFRGAAEMLASGSRLVSIPF